MRRLAAVLLVLALPVAAGAQHPDFTGKWTYDQASSSQSMMSQMSATLDIAQSPATLKLDQSVSSSMGNQSSSLTYNLDGSASKNTVDAQGQSLTLNSTTAWAGDTLVITTTAEVQGQPIKTVDHWSLDSEHKVLTMNTDISVGPQSMTQKKVFKKS